MGFLRGKNPKEAPVLMLSTLGDPWHGLCALSSMAAVKHQEQLSRFWCGSCAGGSPDPWAARVQQVMG